jgi:hypothetical protein
MAKIAVDCDGVLANFTQSFIAAANHIWPGRVSPDYVQTSWHDIGGLTADEILKVWERIRGTRNWWLELNPYPDSIHALQRFLYAHPGHEVYIVTSREETVGFPVAWQTDRWLKACGVHASHSYLGVFPINPSHKKAGLYRLADFDFSVDDRGDTVEQCDRTQMDHTACLLSRTWNADAKVNNRVNNLEEFFNRVVTES